MSASERSPQRQQQQIYYQQQPVQRTLGLGSSSSMLDPSHHSRGEQQQHHQIVVVSGNSGGGSQCTNCVPSYHSAGCECPSCESKILQNIGPPQHAQSSLDHRQHELYSYLLPSEQHGGTDNDEEDGIVREFMTESGERHVVIMTKNDQVQQHQQPEGGLSIQERIRRQKLSEAAKNRYALLSEDEKRAVTERRIIMRQRRKQKEREMEELEAILRATNDITDDLVPVDEASLQRKRAKISRYQTMTIEERREYNQKRRLRQLGLPENIEEVPQEKMEQIKEHIDEVNARKAEAARQRYHRMSHDERKAYNRRRTESFRKRRVEEEQLLSTPAGQITPEALEKAQSIMLRNAKRAEQARLRYQKKQQEKGVTTRRQRKPKAEINTSDSGEPNLDQILDTIERDVVRKTEEAKQALKKMQQAEAKKEEPSTSDTEQQQFLTPAEGGGVRGGPSTHLMESPVNVHQQQVAGQNVIQYVQVPAQSVQNGFIIADGKFMQVHTDSGQPGQPQYTLIQEPPPGSKFEGASAGSNYYQIIQHHESPQRPQHHHQIQSIGGGRPTRIEIVQPTIITTSHGNFEHLTVVPNSVATTEGGGHIIHHYDSQQMQQGHQPYTIQIEQPQHGATRHRQMASSSSHHSHNTRRRVVVEQQGSMSPVDQKLMQQKAKRAERARKRYHEMSVEARHEFNAKRAHALKMARLRDEELCRLGDELSVKGEEPDENLGMAIEQARTRRSKRAEAARIKYQMTSEQRKAHNAMRDAQRKQRKRELEDTVTVVKK